MTSRGKKAEKKSPRPSSDNQASLIGLKYVVLFSSLWGYKISCSDILTLLFNLFDDLVAKTQSNALSNKRTKCA